VELGRKKKVDICATNIQQDWVHVHQCNEMWKGKKIIFMWRHVVITTSAICGVHPQHSRPKPVRNLSRHTDLLCELETLTCSNHHKCHLWSTTWTLEAETYLSRHTDLLCELKTSLLIKGIHIGQMSRLDTRNYNYMHLKPHTLILQTHSLTHSWSWALLEKLPIAQPLKK
jgi:hypothetical protein